MKTLINVSRLSFVLALLLGLVTAWCVATPHIASAETATGGKCYKCTECSPVNCNVGFSDCRGTINSCHVVESTVDQRCDFTGGASGCSGPGICSMRKGCTSCP